MTARAAIPPPSQGPGRGLRRWVLRVAAAYLALVLGVWAAIRFGGDVVPWATVVLFGPRWVFAAPLAALAPAAVCARSYVSSGVVLAAAVVAAGPVTGGTLSMPAGASNEGFRLRVLTCNTDGPALDGRRFAGFLARAQPDIVLVQEVSTSGDLPWLPERWHSASAGRGVAVASRFPVRLFSALGPEELGMPGACGRFAVHTPGGELTVVNLHLPTPRDGLEAVAHNPTAFGPLRDGITGRDHAS
ncbi:MAG TPA: endonuclease/exonuclease/phosphatase family protein, partial [Urbifossiella sp.]|nr:endonuclease/exonuclease/phosphatase family protein [Urbifossiella sp.]